jgi:hypothetical protein
MWSTNAVIIDRKTKVKTLSQCHFVHHKSYLSWIQTWETKQFMNGFCYIVKSI